MRRTSPGILLVLAVLAAAAGYLFDHVLTVTGRATFTPTPFLPVLLILIGAACLALAWPVRRSVRGGTRIDPFRAVRASALARAASLVGSILAGFSVGLAVFLLSRPITPPVGSMVAILALLGGATVLVAAALVAEQFCTLPKDPHDREPDDPAPGADGER